MPDIDLESADETLGPVAANGGAVVAPPNPVGVLRVARSREPAGNVVGLMGPSVPTTHQGLAR
jgi:predicted enzyme related to lactoylglutathione lyase